MAAQFFSSTVTTPGTPQKLIQSTTPSQAAVTGSLSGTVAPRGTMVSIQADPTNTAAKNIYIGTSTLNVAGRTGIGIALAPGAVWELHSESDIDLGNFWIDSDTGATVKNVFVMVA